MGLGFVVIGFGLFGFHLNCCLGFVLYGFGLIRARFGIRVRVKTTSLIEVKSQNREFIEFCLLVCVRSKSNQYPNTSLIQIEGVNTKEEVTWYQGKRMAYIYKAKVKKNGSHYRCIWGKVTRPHGNTGVVRAKFKSNLPPKSMVIQVPKLTFSTAFCVFCGLNSCRFCFAGV
ncbi:putative ribosomal protein L35A [Helianthus debilis subsp. tardiflorus]